jgi:hypothetical protein
MDSLHQKKNKRSKSVSLQQKAASYDSQQPISQNEQMTWKQINKNRWQSIICQQLILQTNGRPSK